MKYRRLWFLLSVLLFVVITPVVVFWTAGYRWNAKKGAIERNGTLIIDTQPTGVRVILNGSALEDRAPFTRQDITPGTYHIRLERDGYYPWEKTLEVRPERVTFVTDVWLWRQSDPTLFRAADVMGMAGSRDGRELAIVEMQEGAPSLTVIPTPGGVFTGGDVTRAFQGGAPTGTVQITWNESGTGVFVEDAMGHAWVAGTEGASGVASALPEGAYRWDGATLVGTSDGGWLSYRLSEGVARRTALPVHVVDEDGGFQIVAEVGARLAVVEQGRETRHFALPQGDWTFAGRERGWLFLRASLPAARWLAFDPRSDEEGISSVNVPARVDPVATVIEGDRVWLSYGDNELWRVTLGDSPELLVRTSEALEGAVWHPKAPAVFYATGHDLMVLGLDARDGREQTTLASFTRIQGVAFASRVVYVAGERNGTSGIWAVAVE